jgi:hypothetical protein
MGPFAVGYDFENKIYEVFNYELKKIRQMGS